MTRATPLHEIRPGSRFFTTRHGPVRVAVRHMKGDLYEARIRTTDEEGEVLSQASRLVDLSQGGGLEARETVQAFGVTLDAICRVDPVPVDSFLRAGLSIVIDGDVRHIMMPASLYEAVSQGTPLAEVSGHVSGALGAWRKINTLPGPLLHAFRAYPPVRRMLQAWHSGMLAETPVAWPDPAPDGTLRGVLITWEEAPVDALVEAGLKAGTNASLDVAMCAQKAVYLPADAGIIPPLKSISEPLGGMGMWVSNVEVRGLLRQYVSFDLMPDSVVLPDTA